ncbi:MAG: hypothetical protein K0Q66_1142 [Chitinophagaceae bacterium]|jgi:hypothetical protein|nr:hypothetical protein [Chitinophagaceae bacterium]
MRYALLLLFGTFLLTACPPGGVLQKYNIPPGAKVENMCDGIKAISNAIVNNQFDLLVGAQQKAGPTTFDTKIWIATFERQYVNKTGNNMSYLAYTKESFPFVRDALQRCILGEVQPSSSLTGYKITGRGLYININKAGGWNSEGTDIYISKEKLD